MKARKRYRIEKNLDLLSMGWIRSIVFTIATAWRSVKGAMGFVSARITSTETLARPVNQPFMSPQIRPARTTAVL
jgi:hypothetical protein